MRVLVVDDNLRDTAAVRLALQTMGCEVVHTVPNDARLREIIQQPFDIVLLDWRDVATPLLMKTIDALPNAPSTLVYTASAAPATVAAAFDAGAEDFFKKPFVRQELMGRVGRIMRTRSRIAGAAAARTEVQARTASATQTGAWREFETLAAACLSGMTMLELSCSDAPSAFKPAFAASMPLAYTRNHLEFRVVIDGSRPALEALSNAAVGLSTPETICDLLNEMTNVAGGAFMRAALGDNIVLTCGLPEAVPPASLEGILGTSHDTKTCWLTDPASHASFRVRLAVRVRGNILVAVASLREGMVLAKDLVGTGGVLLLKAGTRVTSSTSDRVRKMLDARSTVEVADFAA